MNNYKNTVKSNTVKLINID